MPMKTVENIPTEQECFDLMKEHDMLPNIVAHSVQVRNVALAIVDSLAESSPVNRDLVSAAALLHDISKTRTIRTGEMRHDLIGGELLRELGYDEIATITEQHVVLDNFDPDGPLEEKEIVYYADKRVMHDKIVTINTRVDDLMDRYGRDNERIRKMISDNRNFIMTVENKITRFLVEDIDTALSSLIK